MPAPGRGKKAGAPKKKANGYKMPAHIPEGEVIQDPFLKKTWKIGPSIGVGGFGEIYSACEQGSKKESSYDYVIKIEPHENGPLFVEKHFYVRNANEDDIKNFMKSRKLSSLGMPLFYGSSSHDFQGEKYRFVVLQRYGKDVWKMFLEADRSFSAPVVFQLGLQMLDVLEYIHGRGYVHADLKGANILMGREKGAENQAFLVDFGLASKVALDRPFKPDPKCAHDGTIEYTSRDAHLGGTTMRGDLEILAYNMLQWIVGELPWEKVLKQPKSVQAMKEDLMSNVRARLTKDYSNVPNALIKFFEYITTLTPNEQVNFAKCRQIFESYLKSEGRTRISKLDFTAKQVKAKKAVEKTKRKASSDSEDNIPLKKVDEARKRSRGKKPTPKQDPAENDHENELPNDTQDKKVKKGNKRKSSEPNVVASKIKKTKVASKATPPAKKKPSKEPTHASSERQRSLRSSQNQVSPKSSVKFDSPIHKVMNESLPAKNRAASINSSGDIFDDSYEIQKVTTKIRTEEITVEKVVKKTTTSGKKGKSSKDTVVNGRSA